MSSNTPWFFNGVRVQIFTSEHLKIEPWLVNGFQAYGVFNEAPGIGYQLLWRPNGDVSLLSNGYYGRDVLGNAARRRVHSDNGIQPKYRDVPQSAYDMGAVSLTVDVGCDGI